MAPSGNSQGAHASYEMSRGFKINDATERFSANRGRRVFRILSVEAT